MLPPVASAATATSLLLEWEEVTEGSHEKSYTLAWTFSTTANDQSWNYISQISESFYELTNLTSNTKMFFKIVAQNEIHSSGYSNISSAITCKFYLLTFSFG